MNLVRTALSSLSEVASGGGAPQDPATFSTTGIPFVRAGSLVKLLGGELESSLEAIEPEKARKFGLRLFPPGTILFAKSGMSAAIGHIYRLRNSAYVVNHLAALVPHDPVDGAFIAQSLRYFSPTSLVRQGC